MQAGQIPSLRQRAQMLYDVRGRVAGVPIGVILIVAAFLRFNASTQPLVDAFSWRQSSTAMMAENFYRTDWNIFYPQVNWTGPGPSYQGREFQTVSYAAALLYVVVGEHDWVGRCVAVAFGLWGIFALYQLVRRVWDQEHALVSAAVMALLPASIFIERSFLPDPAMVALVTTSFWMLVAYFQTDRLRYIFLAGVIGAWGFCTKLPGVIIGLPMAYTAFALLGRKRLFQPARLVALGAYILLSLGPTVAYYLWARHLALSYPPYHFAGEGHWLWDAGFQGWWNQNYFLPVLGKLFQGWMWTTPVIVFVACGLLFNPVRREQFSDSDDSEIPVTAPVQGGQLFRWWFLAGCVYYIIGAYELVNNPWNFHILNPAAAVLAAHGIITIAAFIGWLLGRSGYWVTCLCCLLIIGITGQDVLPYVYKPYADDSRALGLALNTIAAPDDLVVTIANDIGDPVAIYYSQRHGWVFPPAAADHSWNGFPQDDMESIHLFEQLDAEGADWVGIVNEQINDLRKNHPSLLAYINRTYELKVQTRTYSIYRMHPADTASIRGSSRASHLYEGN